MTVKSDIETDAISGIGDRIKTAAERSGVTLKSLAATVHVPERTFLRYTGGETSPPVDVVVRVANATGAAIAWLMTEEGEPPIAEEARGALMEVAEICNRVLGSSNPTASTASSAARGRRTSDEARPPTGAVGPETKSG